MRACGPSRAALTRALSVVLAAVLTVSCASYRTVSLPAGFPAEASRPEIAPGDRVRIVTTDEQTYEFRVATVGASALVGDQGERVAYVDISRIERRSINKARTTALVLSPVIGMAALLGVAMLGCLFVDCR